MRIVPGYRNRKVLVTSPCTFPSSFQVASELAELKWKQDGKTDVPNRCRWFFYLKRHNSQTYLPPPREESGWQVLSFVGLCPTSPSACLLAFGSSGKGKRCLVFADCSWKRNVLSLTSNSYNATRVKNIYVLRPVCVFMHNHRESATFAKKPQNEPAVVFALHTALLPEAVTKCHFLPTALPVPFIASSITGRKTHKPLSPGVIS